jgi:hypothetical protein
MSTETTPSFDNEDMATAVEEQFKETKQSQREDFAEAKTDKRKILDAFEDETVHVRLKTWRVEMATLDGKTEDWMERTGVEFSDVDEESQLSEERKAEYIDAQENMIRILADHSVADDYDFEFWSQIPKQYRQDVLQSLSSGGIEGKRAGN